MQNFRYLFISHVFFVFLQINLPVSLKLWVTAKTFHEVIFNTLYTSVLNQLLSKAIYLFCFWGGEGGGFCHFLFPRSRAF